MDGDLPSGWLTDAEADELRRVASDRTVLELGAWKGRSTVALAETARFVVSVDNHRGIPWKGGEDTLPDYLAAVRALPNVAVVVGDFETVVPLLGSFDLVFVDGFHGANDVERDAHLARDHAVEMVVFHDWDYEPVRRGAHRALGYRDPDKTVETLAAFWLW